MAIEIHGLNLRVGPAFSCHVILNGVTVAVAPAGTACALSVAIQHEVLPGANRLELLVGTASVAPDSSIAVEVPLDEGAYLEAELDVEQIAEFEDRFEVTTIPMIDRSWKPEGVARLPHREEIEFDASPGVSRPAWLDAASVAEEDVSGEVYEALLQLRAALTERDFERFQALMTVRNRDMALAYPLVGDSARRAAVDTAMLQDFLGSSAAMAEIERDIAVTTEADGKLIIARTASGQSPLRIVRADGSADVELEVGFARIGGRIRPIR
jgi:hypothetical protein